MLIIEKYLFHYFLGREILLMMTMVMVHEYKRGTVWGLTGGRGEKGSMHHEVHKRPFKKGGERRGMGI
jgi:hypothetical protein